MASVTPNNHSRLSIRKTVSGVLSVFAAGWTKWVILGVSAAILLTGLEIVAQSLIENSAQPSPIADPLATPSDIKINYFELSKPLWIMSFLLLVGAPFYVYILILLVLGATKYMEAPQQGVQIPLRAAFNHVPRTTATFLTIFTLHLTVYGTGMSLSFALGYFGGPVKTMSSILIMVGLSIVAIMAVTFLATTVNVVERLKPISSIKRSLKLTSGARLKLMMLVLGYFMTLVLLSTFASMLELALPSVVLSIAILGVLTALALISAPVVYRELATDDKTSEGPS